MTSLRTIKGVLHNFLGTYTSRYSDYDGYWLFGMLVGDIGELKIDLLSPNVGATESAPVAAAIQLAAQKFKQQTEKAGLSISSMREARLNITKSSESRRGVVNGRTCDGYVVRFVIKVVSDHNTTCEDETSVFVAPHDSEVESRSNRGA